MRPIPVPLTCARRRPDHSYSSQANKRSSHGKGARGLCGGGLGARGQGQPVIQHPHARTIQGKAHSYTFEPPLHHPAPTTPPPKKLYTEHLATLRDDTDEGKEAMAVGLASRAAAYLRLHKNQEAFEVGFGGLGVVGGGSIHVWGTHAIDPPSPHFTSPHCRTRAGPATSRPSTRWPPTARGESHPRIAFLPSSLPQK
jgi:hypothetical protein